jgi:hypothetical protein
VIGHDAERVAVAGHGAVAENDCVHVNVNVNVLRGLQEIRGELRQR